MTTNTDTDAGAGANGAPTRDSTDGQTASLTGDTYQKRNISGLLIVCRACSIAGGVGFMAGLLSPVDGILAGIALPLIVGIGIATGMWFGWEVMLTSAARLTTTGGKFGTIAVAVLLAVATFAGSSWGIATAMCGAQAQRAYMAHMLTEESHALDAAWAGVKIEANMIDAEHNAAGTVMSLRDVEASDGKLTGKTGAGPAARQLAATSDGYEQVAGRMQAGLTEIGKKYVHGRQVLQEMQRAINGSPEAFEEKAADVQSVIGDLNAFHLTGYASQGGIGEIDAAFDATSVRLKLASREVNQQLLRRAQEVAAARADATVAVPDYQPISPRLATWREMFGAAVSGFISALAVDGLPLIFFFYVLFTSTERLLLLPVEPDKKREDPRFLRIGRL